MMATRLPLLILPLVIGAWLTVAPAHADVGGQVPGPGLCDYPGVGGSGQVMNGYWYTCDFPIEENGSHWHCAWGGSVLTANGSVGVNVLMFSAGGGLQGYVGGLTGSCSWRCPDMTLAAQPNPPAAWSQHLVPAKCVPVGPNPDPHAPDTETPPAT